MSIIYPPYLLAEKEFQVLWSINDNSWGYFGYDSSFIKQEKRLPGTNEFFSFYWSNSHDLFKIVYKKYEGVFNKLDYPGLSHNSSFGVRRNKEKEIVCFDMVTRELYHVVGKDGLILTFTDKTNSIYWEFKLRQVDINYINNLDENTVILNNLIQSNYESGAKKRFAILQECDRD